MDPTKPGKESSEFKVMVGALGSMIAIFAVSKAVPEANISAPDLAAIFGGIVAPVMWYMQNRTSLKKAAVKGTGE